ncbi:MAG: hypothetical protein ACKVQV_11055 [Bacteroidia bacterium]
MKSQDVFDFNPTWKVKLTVLQFIENDKGGLLELKVVAGGKAEFDYSIRQLRNTIVYSSAHGMLDIFLDNKWKAIPENSSLTINLGVAYRLRNHADSPITFNMKIELNYHFAQTITRLYAFATLPDSEYSRKKHLIELLTECYQTDFEFEN